jgi:coenzyme F420-0:L-glutamate ligase/coenzyme F420-1:gamma-L-glutamate ligase
MELFSVPDLPEVRPGDDLAAMVEERMDLRGVEAADPPDVLVVASTVVSKAEGRMADLSDFPAGPRASEIAARLEDISGDEKDPRFAQAVLEESTEVLMEAPFLLTETTFGHVGVNAGIDRSNVPDHDMLLLPERPSESAARIRANLSVDVPVVVTDTCGRPFRHGQQAVALGWDGMAACRDWRGETDRDGHELGVTVQCVVDELASATNLVAGEADAGTPITVVRDWEFGGMGGMDKVFRRVDSDFVRQALRGWEFEG